MLEPPSPLVKLIVGLIVRPYLLSSTRTLRFSLLLALSSFLFRSLPTHKKRSSHLDFTFEDDEDAAFGHDNPTNFREWAAQILATQVSIRMRLGTSHTKRKT